MKTMVFYELKKIFSLKKSIICAAFMLALCFVIFFINAGQNDLFHRLPGIKEELSTLSGELTSERFASVQQKYEDILNNPDNYTVSNGDRVMKPEIKKEFDKLEPTLFLKNVNEYPQRMISDLNKELEKPDITKSQKLLINKNIEMLSEKGNLVRGYNLFYNYYDTFLRSFAPFLLGFLIIFLIAPIFSSEYSSKMDGLILSSKRGKRGIIEAKFIASFIGISAAFLFIIGTYIAICASVLGFSGGNTSLTTMYYNVFQYLSSPYNLTMIQYFFISLGISYLACIGLGILTMFISSKSRNVLTVSTISVIIFYLPMLFYVVNNGTDNYPAIINFSYASIMQVTPLFDKFNGFVLFGNVVMLKDVLLTLLIMISLAFGFFAYRSFKRHQVAN